MVDVMGHLAFGGLFALPAWFIWQKEASVTFVGLALVTSPLPDIDLWLSRGFPSQFHHHGVTHTILFVVLASLFFGAFTAHILAQPLDAWLDRNQFDSRGLFGFAFLAFLLGGMSHLFADVLSAPDISTPIEPFWPFFDKPVSVDLIYYNDPLWNSVFLLVLLGVHAGLAFIVEPVEHRDHY